MQSEPIKYLLAIKRNNNDFLNIDWKLTKFYNGENLYTLEGIDSFTRKITTYDLINEILEKHLIEKDELFQSFSIIYQTKKGTRELKEGTIFKENNVIYSEDDLIRFIIKNKSNKQLLNMITNLCNFKDKEDKVEEFKFVLKNIDLFESRGANGLKAALSIFKDISYKKKRSIILKITDTIMVKLSQDELSL